MGLHRVVEIGFAVLVRSYRVYRAIIQDVYIGVCFCFFSFLFCFFFFFWGGGGRRGGSGLMG